MPKEKLYGLARIPLWNPSCAPQGYGMTSNKTEDVLRKESQNKRKREQRRRDKKPGGRYEKTYRATDEEHNQLVRTLEELRAER